MWLPKPNPVVYRGTATGLRISAVDGAAFVDNLLGKTGQYNSVTTTAEAVETIKIADNDNLDFGTGNFTLSWKGSLVNWSTAGQFLIYKHGPSPSYAGYVLAIGTDGKISVDLWEDYATAKYTTAYSSAGTGLVNGTEHEITAVITQGASVAFYIDGVAFGSNATLTTTRNVNNAGAFYVSGYTQGGTSAKFAGTVSRVRIYNRALSAVEVLSLYQNGVATADKWGNQTPIYTSDFSAGIDSWNNTLIGGTTDGNIDGVSDGSVSKDNCLRFTSSATTGQHRASRAISAASYKRYQVTFNYYIPTSNTIIDAFHMTLGSTVYSTRGAWTSVTITVDGSSVYPGFGFLARSSGTSSFTGNATDVIYFKDFIVTQLGATLALEPSGINTTNWTDSSTNALNASWPASGYTPNLKFALDGTHSIEIYDSTGKFLRGVLKAVGTGETLDAEIATGTLTALKLYKITATEVNHFGTGLIVGSYFISTGTETCDANNKVKQVLTPSSSGATIVSTKGGATYNFGYKNASFAYNAASYYVIVRKLRGGL